MVRHFKTPLFKRIFLEICEGTSILKLIQSYLFDVFRVPHDLILLVVRFVVPMTNDASQRSIAVSRDE